MREGENKREGKRERESEREREREINAIKERLKFNDSEREIMK